MENTTPYLFDNIDPKYYIAVQGKAVGPLTAQEVFERVHRGEITLMHYLWKQGWSDWKRLCDEREFSTLVPKKPSSSSVQSIKQREKTATGEPIIIPAPKTEVKNYYLYHNRSQYGPFSRTELEHVLKTHKLDRSAYLWMPGWPNWKRMAEIEEFAAHFKSKKAASKSADRTMGVAISGEAGTDESERRRAPRRPLVARLFLHNESEVVIAVCRDISVGGMQVLTDRVPGEVGTTIKLNVSPGDPTKVKSFVAEGEIVRVLEDGRGFSFRFTKVTEEARKAIQKYIKT
ncbi:MAG: GYF domain-containing protein [Bdellovibrionota bacterium]